MITALVSGSNAGSGLRALGPVSRKTQKLFGSVKPFLVYLHLKTEKRMHLKLFVGREVLFMLECVNKTALKTFSVLSRNGPLAGDIMLCTRAKDFTFTVRLAMKT